MIRLVSTSYTCQILREHAQDRLHLCIDHAGCVRIVGFEQFHEPGLRDVTRQRKVSLFTTFGFDGAGPSGCLEVCF